MKGIWRCDAYHGTPHIDGGPVGWKGRCAHWQVHNGNPGKPKRIDVTCDRCNTRHQHVPSPRDRRGRESRIFYERWPDRVDIDQLIESCSRRNAAAAVPGARERAHHSKFVQAKLL